MSTCALPDGTSCEQWAFYRGRCGQAHSYCNLHGGTIATVEVAMGTWTGIVAMCTTAGGQQRPEATFYKNGVCS